MRVNTQYHVIIMSLQQMFVIAQQEAPMPGVGRAWAMQTPQTIKDYSGMSWLASMGCVPEVF
jgi:hypothetical protein